MSRPVSPIEGTEVKTPRAGSMAMSDMSEAPETELRQTLKERHVNMIGFSTVLGIGLFLSAGKAIFLAGPGAAVLAYLTVGTVMWSVMASMGEMTALFPVKGPVFEFPRRFLDESIGLATGWLIWFEWVIISAAEILAVTELFRFKFSEEYLKNVGSTEKSIGWTSTIGVNPAVWVGIFLLIVLALNLLPALQYGRIEYICGCAKLMMLVLLVMFNIIVNARQRHHEGRFWTYESPWGFSTQNMTISDTRVITGEVGRFTAFWTTMTTTLFSLLGMEVILFTAAENADLQRTETIKLSSRKISLRIILLYALATFTVGLNVPYTDANLRSLTINGITGGQNSAFVIASVREHVKGLPHFLNAFFIFSATSTGANSLYSASRTLHAIASIPDAWPSWKLFEAIRSRLERTKYGVPMNAVLLSWLVGFLAFLSVNTEATETLGRIATVAVVANMLVYVINCATYLQFYRAIHGASQGEYDEDLNITPEIRAHFRRSGRRYPYRSHLQWMRATYGLVACLLFALFQGWRTFLSPMSVEDFVASYIAFLLFAVLSLAYFFKARGFNPANWRLRASKLVGLESVGPIVVDGTKLNEPCRYCEARHRTGHLVFPDKDIFTRRNGKALIEWIWVWMK